MTQRSYFNKHNLSRPLIWLCVLVFSAFIHPASAQYLPYNKGLIVSPPVLVYGGKNHPNPPRVLGQNLHLNLDTADSNSRWLAVKDSITPSYRSLSPKLDFSPRQLWAPGAFILAGSMLDLSAAVKDQQIEFRQKHMPGFHTAVDNVLLFAPALAPYALDLAGLKSKTDIANRTAILIKSELLANALSFGLKHTVKETRPDASNQYSFPSGHALQAFAAATLLSEEYKDRYPWMPYASYGVATSVGLLRIANNKHYLGDVLVGAGLGILSTKIIYWTHRYKWNKKKQKALSN